MGLWDSFYNYIFEPDDEDSKTPANNKNQPVSIRPLLSELYNAIKSGCLKIADILYYNNDEKWILVVLILGVFAGIFVFLNSNNLTLSVFSFFAVEIALVYLVSTIRSKKCRNFFSIKFFNSKTINTRQEKRYFTRRILVGESEGESESRYHYVNGGSRTVATSSNVVRHYEIRHYVKVITIDTVEDLYKCEICGAITKRIRNVVTDSYTHQC